MFTSSCYCLWMLSNLLLSFFPPFLFCSALPVFAAPPCALQYQSEGSRPHLPKLDLEQWYQELMAGSQLCPPPLPAKSLSGRRPVLQVEGLSSFSCSPPHSIFLLCVCVRCCSSTRRGFNNAAFTSYGKDGVPHWSLLKATIKNTVHFISFWQMKKICCMPELFVATGALASALVSNARSAHAC